MLSAKDIGGAMGMMPAFATDDAVDIRATQTIAVDNLAAGVDRIIKDGIDVISTTGTYGECYNLLWEEFQTITTAAVDTVKKRVPLFIGVTSPNSREVVRKMNFVKDTDADGVLLGVPYYETLPLPDAVRFFHDIADMFPTLNILIYHNPGKPQVHAAGGGFQGAGEETLHHRHEGQSPHHQPVPEPSADHPGQDQRVREPDPALALLQHGRRRLLVHRGLDGPWPILHLRNLVRRGENDKAAEVIADIMTASQGKPVPGEGFKRPAEYADYCKVGPTRVPFLNFPDVQIDRAKKRAAHWMEMNERYRPLVEAESGRNAA